MDEKKLLIDLCSVMTVSGFEERGHRQIKEILNPYFDEIRPAGVAGLACISKCGKENAAIIRKIQSSSPDLLFVCFGFPLQEKWIYENRAYLSGVGLCMGLGGSLDVWSGKVRRAPKPIIDMKLEWLWRTLSSRERLSAIPTLCSFSLAVLSEAPFVRLVEHVRKKSSLAATRNS